MVLRIFNYMIIIMILAATAWSDPSIDLSKNRGWKLSGGKGNRQKDKISKQECLTVTGTGNKGDSNYWKYSYKFKPQQVYKISCLVRTSKGAKQSSILIGSNLVNRDVRARESWERKEFIFQTPMSTGNAYLRFGQWQVKGTVWFRDISVTEVQPVHAQREGYQLGSGEIVEDNEYRAAYNFKGYQSNYSRCLHEHQAQFNTNRFVLGNRDYLVFKHQLKTSRRQHILNGKVKLHIGHYTRGKCAVEISNSGNDWHGIGSLSKKGEKSFSIPRKYLPSREVYVRLIGSGMGANFQIYGYAIEADVTDDVPDFSGGTEFADLLQQLDDLSVKVESIGTSADKKHSTILQLENKTARTQTYEVKVESEGRSEKKAVSIAAGKSTIVEIPAADASMKDAKKTIIVTQKGVRGSAFIAQAEIKVPYMQKADYGHLISTGSGVTLWWTDATRKISKDRTAPVGPKSDTIEMFAAKNEYEAAQIVIRPDKELKNVRVDVTSFRNSRGQQIDKNEIQILLVEYVSITNPTDPVGTIGLWPDPLPPYKSPFKIEKGKNQPLWLLIHVPETAQKGEYTGKLKLRSGRWKKELPVRLNVWDFELPKETHLQSSMGLDVSLINKYQKRKGNDDVVEKYLKNFAEHRISPFNPFVDHEIKENFNARSLKADLNFNRFDGAIDRLFDKYKFNTYRMKISGLGSGTFHSRKPGELAGLKQGNRKYDKLLSDYLSKMQNHFDNKDLLDKAYIYWFDEPDEKDYPFVKETMGRIKKAAPKFTRMLTEQPTPELYGYVDLWCPLLSEYDHEIAESRRKKGERFWWYICTVPKEPYPTLFIDHYAVELRTWIWQSWKYDIEGILIWRTNYWTSNAAYPSPKTQNPYKDPMSYKSGYGLASGEIKHWGNGDGRLIYPPKNASGRTRSLDGPVSSIRWEMLREGMEDYEYFWLLRDAINRLSKKRGNSSLLKEARKLLEVPEEVAKSITEYAKTPEPMYKHRAKMAEMIEKLRDKL